MRQALAYIDSAVPLLDVPAGDAIKRRSAKGLAGVQAETRMVPRTTDGVPDEQTVRERRAVMRAKGTDRIQLLTAPCKDDRLAMCVPLKDRTVRDSR